MKARISASFEECVSKQGLDVLPPPPTEKTQVCDCCEEQWEQSFFCEKCSGIQYFDGEQVLEPNHLWEGSPNDEYIWTEREPEYMDICFNCCNCNI